MKITTPVQVTRLCEPWKIRVRRGDVCRAVEICDGGLGRLLVSRMRRRRWYPRYCCPQFKTCTGVLACIPTAPPQHHHHAMRIAITCNKSEHGAAEAPVDERCVRECERRARLKVTKRASRGNRCMANVPSGAGVRQGEEALSKRLSECQGVRRLSPCAANAT